MGILDYVVDRVDSWLNVAMGFGGVSDKIKQTRYSGAVRRLNDPELTAMYRTEHLSAKIVNVYPKEAYREGFEVAGYEADGESDGADDTEEQVCNVLRSWQVVQLCKQAAIWGRLYGGAVVWMGSYTADPGQPFVMGEKIDFLRVIDRRYLQPRPWALDALGHPTLYDIVPEEGRGMVGPVHVSRLVMFPGALTDHQTRVVNGFWDDSVLQVAYDSLQSDGIVWRSAQQLVSEASVGVLKIKGLYQKLSGAARQTIENRLAFFNASRSVARNMTLDFDGEDYKRESVQFAGLSDLSMEGLKRVASAAEIPVSILLSDEPSGLNATGDSSIRWWLMRVHAYRTGELEVPTLYLCKCILAQSGIASIGDRLDKLALKWPNLWTPSAGEQADIRLKGSQADQIDIDAGIITPTEAALAHYGKDGYSQEITIDRSLRMPPTEDDLASAAAGATGGTGDTGETDPNAPPPEDKPADTAMNGAQITGLQEVVRGVSAKEIPRDSGLALVKAALGHEVTPEEIIGSAGAGFTPAAPEPAPAPFGGKPGAPPEPAPGDDKQTPAEPPAKKKAPPPAKE